MLNKLYSDQILMYTGRSQGGAAPPPLRRHWFSMRELIANHTS
jgi:hypothetical protein